jgi:hypothetical protein
MSPRRRIHVCPKVAVNPHTWESRTQQTCNIYCKKYISQHQNRFSAVGLWEQSLKSMICIFRTDAGVSPDCIVLISWCLMLHCVCAVDINYLSRKLKGTHITCSYQSICCKKRFASGHTLSLSLFNLVQQGCELLHHHRGFCTYSIAGINNLCL